MRARDTREYKIANFLWITMFLTLSISTPTWAAASVLEIIEVSAIAKAVTVFSAISLAFVTFIGIVILHGEGE